VHEAIPEFAAQGLANTAWSFAKLKFGPEPLIKSLADSSQLRITKFTASQLAKTSWAFATLRYMNELLVTSIATRSRLLINELDAQGEIKPIDSSETGLREGLYGGAANLS